MSKRASQITSLTIVYSTVYSGPDQTKHQSSASLAFVWGIHRGPVNSPQKWPVTRKMFPFDDVIMFNCFIVDGLPWCHHASGIYLVNKSQCAIHGIRPFTTTCGRCRTDFGTLWHVYRVRFHRAVKRPSFLMAWCQNGARAFLNFPRWHGWTRNQTSSSLISHPYMYYDIRYYFWKLLCRHLLPLCCQLLLVDICAGKYVWWVMIYGDMPR